MKLIKYSSAQQIKLLNIFNQTPPQKYKVAGIKVTGNKYFDESLLISVSGLTIGDEITIPGADNFSKANSSHARFLSGATPFLSERQ